MPSEHLKYTPELSEVISGEEFEQLKKDEKENEAIKNCILLSFLLIGLIALALAAGYYFGPGAGFLVIAIYFLWRVIAIVRDDRKAKKEADSAKQ